MHRILGLTLLLLGFGLLYWGWQLHEEAAAAALVGTVHVSSSKSIWLLASGAIASIWGLFALQRRTLT